MDSKISHTSSLTTKISIPKELHLLLLHNFIEKETKKYHQIFS